MDLRIGILIGIVITIGYGLFSAAFSRGWWISPVVFLVIHAILTLIYCGTASR